MLGSQDMQVMSDAGRPCPPPSPCSRQYTKLHVWELEEFSRVVYLDADTLVIGPIDALFSVPHAFAAVSLCPHPPTDTKAKGSFRSTRGECSMASTGQHRVPV